MNGGGREDGGEETSKIRGPSIDSSKKGNCTDFLVFKRLYVQSFFFL